MKTTTINAIRVRSQGHSPTDLDMELTKSPTMKPLATWATSRHGWRDAGFISIASRLSVIFRSASDVGDIRSLGGR
jgi:hypothetical protein